MELLESGVVLGVSDGVVRRVACARACHVHLFSFLELGTKALEITAGF